MLNNKVNKGFTKIFNSGKWYMVISNETPMTNDGKVYCGFDLIKNKNSLYGFPVNQFGTIEDILQELQRRRKSSKNPEFDCLKEINKDKYKMYEEFISILENELQAV